MNRKDIALTVGGVVATMALAYLFYRRQTQNAGTAATQTSTSDGVTDPNYYADQSGLYDESLAYQMGQAASSISVPSLSTSSGATVDSSSSVDTSSTTAAIGSTPGTDANDLLSQIISAYASGTPATSANDYQETDYSGLAIPSATVTPSQSITGIPTTAAQATANADNMLGVSGTTGGAVSAPSIVPVAVTTRPVSAHPIVSTGS